jgi:hypothetical protein
LFIYLIVAYSLCESVKWRQIQIDCREQVEEFFRLEIVILRILDLQVYATLTAQLKQIEVEHSRQSVNQFLEI